MASFRDLQVLTGGTRTNSTVTKPTGTVAGDILLCLMDLESDIPVVPPSGWEHLATADHATQTFDAHLFWKRAGSAEPTNYTWLHNSTWSSVIVWAVQDASLTAVPKASTAQQGTDNSAECDSLNTLGNDAYNALALVTFNNPGLYAAPGGFTERHDAGMNTFMADRVVSTPQATGSQTITLVANHQGWIAFQIVVEDDSYTSTDPYIQPVGVSAQVAGNSSPLVPVIPADSTTDDWMLLICTQATDDAPTFGPPVGWNSIGRADDSTRNMVIEVFAKKHDGSESDPSTTCSAPTSGWTAQIITFRGCDLTTLEDATEVPTNAAAAATWTPTGITTATNFARVLNIVLSKDDNAINFDNGNHQGFTMHMGGPNYDTTLGNGSDQAIGVASKIIPTAGAVTNPTWRQFAVGSDQWIGLTFALKPPANVTSGTSVASLPNLTSSASGDVDSPPAGSLASTLPSLATAASGTKTDPDISEEIASTNDDVVYFDLLLGLQTDYEETTGAGFSAADGGPTFSAGLRFTSLAIPQGAVVDSAVLYLNVLTIAGTPNTSIYGADVDDASAWSDPAFRPDTVARTSASVSGPTSTGEKQIDVTAIVQEIVNRGGWASGNDLALVGITNVTSGTNYWRAEDFVAAGTNHARLWVNYTVGAPSGSGSPSLPNLTAASAGIHKQTGSSVNTLPNLTSAATGVMQPSGSSVNTLPALATAASATHKQSGTSANTLPSLLATATSVHAQSGTSVNTLPSLSLAATGVMQPSGTSALTLPSLFAAVSAVHNQTGASAPTLPSLALAASGTSVASAFGAAILALPSLTSASSAIHAQSGASTSALPALTSLAAGTHQQSGTSSSTLPSLNLAATGVLQPSGTATAALPSLALLASATQTQSATAAVSLPSLSALATGVMQPSGSITVMLPSLAVAQAGEQTLSGTLVSSLPSLSLSATGVMQPSGASATTLPSLALAASGQLAGVSTGAATLPSLSALSTGVLQPSGTAASTLPSLSLTGAATQTYTATSSATLPSLALAATGAVGAAPTGSAALALPSLASTATGTQTLSASSAVTLPALSALATGVMQPSGTAVVTLPKLAATATGTQAFTGASASTLPSLTSLASATLKQTGTAASTLPSLACSATGSLAGVSAGQATLPSLMAVVIGTQTQSATAAAFLPSLAVAASGYLLPEGDVAVTLPSLNGLAMGLIRYIGTGTDTLPSLAITATGTAVFNNQAHPNLPSLAAIASGGLTQRGAVLATLPSLAAATVGRTDILLGENIIPGQINSNLPIAGIIDQQIETTGFVGDKVHTAGSVSMRTTIFGRS